MDIELIKWSKNNKEDLIAICNAVDRTYLANRLPFPYTEEDALWWLNMVAERDGINGIFRAIAVNGQIIGTISIEQKEDVSSKDAEIGYFLHTDHWSQGIMTEAINRICTIVFCDLDIIHITGLVYQPNVASQKVLEKNGFLLEGILKNAVVKNGCIYDLCIYGKQKESIKEGIPSP